MATYTHIECVEMENNVIKKIGLSSSNGGIVALYQTKEQAISTMLKNNIRYTVENTSVNIIAEKYLRTDPNQTEVDDLGNRPKCKK